MSISVVVFGFILVAGVFLLILWWDLNKRGKTANMPTSKVNNIPDKFDPDFIKKRLAEVQNSPNVLAAYAEALMMRFQGSAEKLALRGMMSQYDVLAEIIDSEKKVYRATTERNEAKTDYDISADP